MPDLKWQYMKEQMRAECKRVAKAWGVPVENVNLQFRIYTNEPDDLWGFYVRIQPKDDRLPEWQSRGFGGTFKDAADDCIERKQFCHPHELP